MEERRIVQRFEEEIYGSLNFREKADPSIINSISIKVLDISLHGAKLILRKHFPLFSTFKMTLNLEKTHQIVSLDARTVWIKFRNVDEVYEMGVEFFHDEQTIEGLQRHLYPDRSWVVD